MEEMDVEAVDATIGPAAFAVVLTIATEVDCVAATDPEADRVAAVRLVAVDEAHAGGLEPGT